MIEINKSINFLLLFFCFLFLSYKESFQLKRDILFCAQKISVNRSAVQKVSKTSKCAKHREKTAVFYSISDILIKSVSRGKHPIIHTVIHFFDAVPFCHHPHYVMITQAT